MNVLLRIFVILLVVVASGCAVLQPMESKEFFGLQANPTAEERVERPVGSVVFVIPPKINEADVYSTQVPKERKAEVACRTFEDFEGESIEVCRRAFRVEIDGNGKLNSALIVGDSVHVFLPRGKEFTRVNFLSADGTSGTIVPRDQFQKLDEREVLGAYERLTRIFPNASNPIEGTDIAFLFGDDYEKAKKVLGLATLKERAWACGAMSFSTSEVAMIAVGNPLAVVSKALAGFCMATTEPNMVREEPKKESTQNQQSEYALAGER